MDWRSRQKTGTNKRTMQRNREKIHKLGLQGLPRKPRPLTTSTTSTIKAFNTSANGSFYFQCHVESNLFVHRRLCFVSWQLWDASQRRILEPTHRGSMYFDSSQNTDDSHVRTRNEHCVLWLIRFALLIAALMSQVKQNLKEKPTTPKHFL